MKKATDSEPHSIIVVPTEPKHAAGIELLQAETYQADPHEWDDMVTVEKVLTHLQVFPEGQFVAVDTATDRVVGLTSAMCIDFDPAQPFLETWVHTTDYGYLTTHRPGGLWMYGVESAVHPAYQGRGIGSKLMDARFDVLRQLNLRGMVAGSAIIDYHTAPHLSPEQYVQEVMSKRRFDTNLSKQLHKGFRVHNIIPNYLDDDPEGTLGYGVAIVWYNPEHRPHARSIRQVKRRRYPVVLRPAIRR